MALTSGPAKGTRVSVPLAVGAKAVKAASVDDPSAAHCRREHADAVAIGIERREGVTEVEFLRFLDDFDPLARPILAQAVDLGVTGQSKIHFRSARRGRLGVHLALLPQAEFDAFAECEHHERRHLKHLRQPEALAIERGAGRGVRHILDQLAERGAELRHAEGSSAGAAPSPSWQWIRQGHASSCQCGGAGGGGLQLRSEGKVRFWRGKRSGGWRCF